MRKRKLRAIGDIEDSINNGLGPKSTAEFICILVERLFKRMEPVLASLDERTDNIEENIIENPNTQHREEIIDIRRKAIIFRRYMAPQRDAINNMRLANLSWMDDTDKKRLSESINHVTRFIEDLDAIRERAQIVKDELANILSDRATHLPVFKHKGFPLFGIVIQQVARTVMELPEKGKSECTASV